MRVYCRYMEDLGRNCNPFSQLSTRNGHFDRFSRAGTPEQSWRSMAFSGTLSVRLLLDTDCREVLGSRRLATSMRPREMNDLSRVVPPAWLERQC